MTEPKTRDEMAEQFAEKRAKYACSECQTYYTYKADFLAGYDAHAAEAKERERRLWEMLEKVKDLLPEMGALYEEPENAWTKHPAISYVEFQLEKSTIKDAAKWLSDLAAMRKGAGCEQT